MSKNKNPGCLIFILSLFAISVGIVLALKNYGFSILSLGFIGIIIGSHYIKKGITPEEAHRRELLKEKKAAGIVSGDIPRKDQIDYTKIVAQVSEKSTGSAVARGAIGLAIAGQVGVTAALTAKNKETTTFLIAEKDGHKDTVVTRTNSNISCFVPLPKRMIKESILGNYKNHKNCLSRMAGPNQRFNI